LRGIKVLVDHLEWVGGRFRDVRLTARPGALHWLVEVNSLQVEGHIAAPLAVSSNTPLLANLIHLYVAPAGYRTTSEIVDRRTLPSLRIACKALCINDLEYSGILLRTTRIRNGLRVDALEVVAADFQGRTHGSWQVVGAKHQHSRFEAEFESSDLGSVLDRWGVISSAHDGDASVEARLAWTSVPFGFNLQGLNGRMHLRIEQAQLREVNPGAGRLFGLLNTNAIVRRLALDFSDLLRSGFSFDLARGDLTFTDSTMYTDNSVIKGPSADIDITGRIDLVSIVMIWE
jgi:uncharacterized protein YhdP